MNGNVDDMIAGYRKTVDSVVEGKGEVSDIALYEMGVQWNPFCLQRVYKIIKVLHNGIIDNKALLIPLKRSIEGVRIDNDN